MTYVNEFKPQGYAFGVRAAIDGVLNDQKVVRKLWLDG